MPRTESRLHVVVAKNRGQVRVFYSIQTTQARHGVLESGKARREAPLKAQPPLAARPSARKRPEAGDLANEQPQM